LIVLHIQLSAPVCITLFQRDIFYNTPLVSKNIPLVKAANRSDYREGKSGNQH